MLRLQNLILEMVAKGEDLNVTANRLCEEIEKILPDVVCSLLTVDEAGRLHPLAAPSLPASYSAVLDGLMAGPLAGSCGTAAYLREDVSVTDIANDERWALYREYVLPLGLKACWSSPIIDSNGRVLGTFAFYYKQCRGPDKLEEELVATSLHLCSIAIERHERYTERQRLATLDALTGLANRSCFNATISALSCTEPGAWALLLIDVDNLKTINDTFGHRTGDALIREVATRVAKACHPHRAFRVGGDEFAVIIQAQSEPYGIDGVAEQILKILDEPADCNGHLVQPQATIGGAVLSRVDTFAESVRQNADFALYHAKETSRGGFVRYWPGLGTAITHRLNAIQNVLAALREDRIEAFYQPIVRMDDHQVVGVEALCRIRADDGTLIPAVEFCEATADAHVATGLTANMLKRIAQDVRTWLDFGVELQHVSFNVSSADFHIGRLHKQIADTFSAHNVPLEMLVVEVNEGVYLGKRDMVVAREIDALRRAGLRVALDDFGTGFASLTHLLTVPIDVIKVDKTFIERLSPNDPSSTILEGVFNIARKLGITVIAEGIETEQQANQLLDLKCALGQGYFFAPPLGRLAAHEMLCTSTGLRGIVAA